MIKFLVIFYIIVMFIAINCVVSTNNRLESLKRKQRKNERKLDIIGLRLTNIYTKTAETEIKTRNNMTDIADLSKRIDVLEKTERKAGYNAKRRKAHRKKL